MSYSLNYYNLALNYMPLSENDSQKRELSEKEKNGLEILKWFEKINIDCGDDPRLQKEDEEIQEKVTDEEKEKFMNGELVGEEQKKFILKFFKIKPDDGRL